MRRIIELSVIGVLLVPAPVLAMEPMDETEMSAISGREGAVLELALQLNADNSGLLDTSIEPVERRLAFQYANRGWKGGSVGGDWLVATDFKLILNIPYLGLNSTDIPSSYNHGQGKAGYLGDFDPYGGPALELSFDKPVEIGMNNGLAITRDQVSNGSIVTPGWARTDLTPFVGIRIGEAGPNGTGRGPTQLQLDGQGHLFGYSND